jgi:PKD repeat protein
VTFGVDPASDTFVGGTYTVQLTVTGSGGSTSTATRTVTVTGAPVPTNLRNSRSGTSQTYRWNAATPNVNGYQVWIDFVGGCSDRTLTTTGTSQVVNYGGSSSNTCARQAHDMRVRSRDSVTGKWGAWSPPRRVN